MNPGSIDALANAWPMLGVPIFNIGKRILGETNFLDTLSNVTIFVIEYWPNIGFSILKIGTPMLNGALSNIK